MSVYAELLDKRAGRDKEIIALADLAALQQTLGIFFNDTTLLEQALIHTSYVNEQPGITLVSNERLEFLGDAVLDLVVAEVLYQDFPHSDEGKMTRIRATLVRRDTLACMAITIKLGDYLCLGKGEETSDGRSKPTNLAGAFEAIIAAIFLDQGIIITREFILSLFEEELQRVASHGVKEDYKSQLQEFIQIREQQTPAYQVVETTGPDHDRRFTVEVSAGDNVLGRGFGKSKKAAETEAARTALKNI